jgi:hypothetical protein
VAGNRLSKAVAIDLLNEHRTVGIPSPGNKQHPPAPAAWCERVGVVLGLKPGLSAFTFKPPRHARCGRFKSAETFEYSEPG